MHAERRQWDSAGGSRRNEVAGQPLARASTGGHEIRSSEIKETAQTWARYELRTTDYFTAYA